MQKEPTVADYVGDRIAQHCGYPAMFCQGMVNLRLGLGLSDQVIQSIVATIRSEAQIDAEVDVQSATTAADIERWVQQPPMGWAPRVHLTKSTTSETVQVQSTRSMMQRKADPYVVSGISLGLPGGEKVFDEDVFERLVRGETCIQEVSDEYKQRLLDKNITRLIKGRDGSVNMEQATSFGDIPQLAGVKGAFDLAEEFGIDPKIILAWDITTQLAMASGLLALRDAGIPLTPEEQTGKGGLRLIRNWQVPSVHRDRTGIVFASCFPGLQMAMKHAKTDGDDGEGKFDRRYLFQTLTMSHSQFAQFTGIRGPTTTINLACASATGAFQIAEDWLAADRVDRVVILSSDDVTGDDLWEWIGSGFASTGAASTATSLKWRLYHLTSEESSSSWEWGLLHLSSNERVHQMSEACNPSLNCSEQKQQIPPTMERDLMLSTSRKQLMISWEKWRGAGISIAIQLPRIWCSIHMKRIRQLAVEVLKVKSKHCARRLAKARIRWLLPIRKDSLATLWV